MRTQSNKLDFTGQNIFVGFDVHVKSWTVTIMTESISHKTFSQDPSPEKLYQYLVKNFPGGTYHSAYEAGYCGYWIHNHLKSFGVNSIVVNPADIPTTHKEKIMKTDPRDSKKIARQLRAGELVPIYVPSLKNLEDRALTRHRTTLVQEITRNKNRVKSILRFHGIEFPETFKNTNTHWSKRFTKWLMSIKMTENTGTTVLTSLVSQVEYLRERLLELTKVIRELSKTETYYKRIKLLRSIPGIGLITAMLILTELETINRFSNIDQLAGYIGLVPSTFSSGENEVIGNITKRGHSVIRPALIESAWMATRLDPALIKSYGCYRNRMEPNEAIIRIAKKLLRRIKFVLTNEKEYEYAIV
jgi:transposase